jgi:hypothetical protein
MADVSGFVVNLAGYLARYGANLASVWTSTSANAEGVLNGSLDSACAIEAFLREREIELQGFQEDLLSSARAVC